MAKFVIDDAVSAAWGRLTSDTSSTSWIACGYPEGSSTQLVFKGEGSGGMPEFIASLPADDIVWGAVKVVAVDDRGNLVSRRPKYVSVKYCPSSVAAMKRAKSGGHKGAVKQVMTSHIDVEIEAPEELTEEAIIAKLRACGGAHQPTGYEFSNYSVSSGSLSPVRTASPVPARPAPAPAAAPAPAPAAAPVEAPVAGPVEAPTTAAVAEEVQEVSEPAAAKASTETAAKEDEATGIEEATADLSVQEGDKGEEEEEAV